ncbi:MAG: class I SAM-dependent methyltransferase [Anaerolineae bacterium]|jgi:SAM-dependent methyltransferase
MAQDYLKTLLKSYWFAPPVALWRAIELRVVGQHCWSRPVLDLGCGDGLIGQALFDSGCAIDVGLDPWFDQLRQAARLGVYRCVSQAAGRAMPFPNQHFSTVFSNSVLEHIPQVTPVLEEVARVLRPGGRFVFTVPSDAFRTMLDGYAQRLAMGDSAGAEAYAAEVDERLDHRQYHGPHGWSELLAYAGMTLVEATYYIPHEVERFWDRMNARFGVGRRGSAWSLLVSPRLAFLGFQRPLRWLVVRRFSHRWRRYYELDVRPGDKGGALLIKARRD